MTPGDELPLWGRVWMGLGFAIPVLGGLAAAVLGDATSFRVGGAAIAIGLPLAFLALRVRHDSTAAARSDDGVVVLPRRWVHGSGLALACAALAVGTGAFAIADRDADRVGSTYRGDPEVMIYLFSPPLAVAAVLLAGGTLLGRGRLRVGPDGVRYTRIARTAREASWDEVTEARLVDGGTVLQIDRRRGHVRVPLAGQLWPGETLVGIVNRYRNADAAERQALTDPSALDRVPLPGRSQAPGD